MKPPRSHSQPMIYFINLRREYYPPISATRAMPSINFDDQPFKCSRTRPDWFPIRPAMPGNPDWVIPMLLTSWAISVLISSSSYMDYFPELEAHYHIASTPLQSPAALPALMEWVPAILSADDNWGQMYDGSMQVSMDDLYTHKQLPVFALLSEWALLRLVMHIIYWNSAVII